MTEYNLETMTAQEVLNAVVEHAIAQPMKSECSDGTTTTCMYRAPSGLKCFAGIFIPDAVFHEPMENIAWGDLVSEYPSIPDAHCRLIGRLQTIHDANHVQSWPKALLNVADQLDLEISEKQLERLNRAICC